MFKQTMHFALLSLAIVSIAACGKKKTVIVAPPEHTTVHVETRVSGVVSDTQVEWSENDLK